MLKILKRIIMTIFVFAAIMFFISVIIQPHQQTTRKKELPTLIESKTENVISAVGFLIVGSASWVLISTFEKKDETNE